MGPGLALRLVPPAEAHRESFLSACREFRREGLRWWFGGDLETVEENFAGFVAKKLADANPIGPEAIPKTHRWALEGDRWVGRISVHHWLNEALQVEGGHIGYDTVPSARGRGVATEMLRQVLPVAQQLGLSEVLITCDDTNLASIRVIEKNGGVLRQIRSRGAGVPAKRYYWIDLS